MASDFEAFSKRSAAPLLPKGVKVEDFILQNLSDTKKPTYSQIRSRFTPDEAATASRFMLSELVSNQLSVEEEEKRRFDKKVLEVVEAQVNTLKEAAYKDGFDKGSEQGKSEAYEQEKARLAKTIEALATVMNSLTAAKTKLGEQYETVLVEMAFRIAKIIVHNEIAQRPEIISKTIADILSRIAKDDDVMIRLSSAEFEAIEQIKEDVKLLSRAGRISFDVDQNMPQGNCIVESLSGEITSDIEVKFQKLEVAVRRGMEVEGEKEKTGT